MMKKEKILEYVKQFVVLGDRALPPTRVPASGPVLGEEEVCALVDCALSMWLTEGRYAEKFRWQLTQAVGQRYAVLHDPDGNSVELFAALPG